MNEALKTAVLSLLRPLVRYLIGQGWTFGALADRGWNWVDGIFGGSGLHPHL